MSKLYSLAEQSAEYAVLNYSGEELQSELDDVKIAIPKEFIDEFGQRLAREVFDWVVENVGLMDDQQWAALKDHLGIEE